MPSGTASARRRQLVGRKAALSRSRPVDDPEYQAVCRDHGYTSLADEFQELAERAAALVAEWPPLSEQEIQTVAALLRVGTIPQPTVPKKGGC